MFKSILLFLNCKIQILMISYHIYYLKTLLRIANIWLQYHLSQYAIFLLLTRFAVKPKGPV